MNIQQYYKQTAIVALNDGLAALLFPVVFAFICMRFEVLQKFIIFIIPFLIFSFASFFVYLLNVYRSKHVSWHDNDHKGSLFTSNDYLITFLPAGTIHLLIFHPNGKLIGEIKEQKHLRVFTSFNAFTKKRNIRDYALFNREGFQEGRFQIDNRGHLKIVIFDTQNEVVGYCANKKGRRKHVMTCEFITDTSSNDYLEIIYSRIYPHVTIYNHRKERVAYLQKGWLPMEWGKRFKDSNTPLLTFDPHATTHDKLMVFGFLSLYFNKYHH